MFIFHVEDYSLHCALERQDLFSGLMREETVSCRLEWSFIGRSVEVSRGIKVAKIPVKWGEKLERGRDIHETWGGKVEKIEIPGRG